jgi:hypothetical protein
MMTKSNVKNVIMIALLIFGAVSCKKDKAEPAPTVYPEESFFDGYLNSTGFSQSTQNGIILPEKECGLEFKPTVKGKITSLQVKLLKINPNLRVIIWDKATQMPIRIETVNVAAANTQYDFDIADLELVKDKEYAITMKNQIWYHRSRSNGTDATYPVVSGNITIIAYKAISSPGYFLYPPKYPIFSSTTGYEGDCSFKFKQID